MAPSYVIQRALYAVPIAIGVTVICFALIYLGPVDPVAAVTPDDATPEQIAMIRAAYGFDRPLPVQYFTWLGHVATGDLGVSIQTGRPVAALLLPALANTVTLALFATVFSFTLAFGMGVLAASWHDRWPDRALSAVAAIGVSIPSYWFAIILVIVFSVELNWLPAMGIGPGGAEHWAWDFAHLKHLILPVVAISMIPIGVLARTTRAAVLEILSNEFVEALRARGLPKRRIMLHVLRNAAPTVLAVVGAAIRADARRLDPDRNNLRLARLRISSLPSHLQARPAGPPRNDRRHRAALRRHQPPRGSAAELARSAHPKGLRVRAEYWSSALGRLRGDPLTVAFALLILAIFGSALLAPWIAPFDPSAGSALRRLAPIGTQGHWLGTDELGRDMLSRLLHGGRVSLTLGVLPVLLALLIGGTLGIAAGFIGGHTNALIMRTMDVFYAFPSVLLAIGLSGVLGAGPRNLIVAVTAVLTPQIARVAESVTTQVRSFGFVEAARASGAGTALIIRYHVLRNVLGPILVFATSLVSVSMIISAGLNFLGFGVQPPTPDWGLMLNTLRQSIWINPEVAVLPGLMIFLTSFCFSQLSDSLRSALDVKLQ